MRNAVLGSMVIGGFLLTMSVTAIVTERRIGELAQRIDDAWEELVGRCVERSAMAEQLLDARGESQAKDRFVIQEAQREFARAAGSSPPDDATLRIFEMRLRAMDATLSREGETLELTAALEANAEAIALSTERFNAATLAYNRLRRRFPTVLVAMAAGYGDRPYLNATTSPDGAN